MGCNAGAAGAELARKFEHSASRRNATIKNNGDAKFEAKAQCHEAYLIAKHDEGSQ